MNSQELSLPIVVRKSASCRECGLCEVPSPGTGDPVRTIVESVVRKVVESLASPPSNGRMVTVGVSARHLHITQDNLEKLFGTGYQLTKLRDLNQPGEFAANETVTVIGPKRRSLEIRILGPVRKITQVEMAYSDGVFLGVDLPHRLSGDIKGSAPLVLVGPKGVIQIPEGAIRAKRHIHVNPADARRLNVRNGQIVSVRTSGEMGVSFHNVVIREGENLNLEMHIDTDEANASALRCGDQVELVEA